MKPESTRKYALLVEERLRGPSWQAMSLHDTKEEARAQLKKCFPGGKHFVFQEDEEADEILGTFTDWRQLHFAIKGIEILK